MEEMQATIDQLQFEKEQRDSEKLKSLPQKSKLDELNREIQDLREKLEEKDREHIEEITGMKHQKLEMEHEMKSMQNQVIQA